MSGPYQVAGLAWAADGGGESSLGFYLQTPAARAAFADGGVRMFIVDAVTGEFGGDLAVLRGP
jgi:hypothetical protein